MNVRSPRKVFSLLAAATLAVISVPILPAATATSPTERIDNPKPAPTELTKLHINTLRNLIRDNPNIPDDVKATRVKLTKAAAIAILDHYPSVR